MGYEHFYTTGTVTVADTAYVTERIRAPNDESIKCIIIETDGPMMVTGDMWTRSTTVFTIENPVGVVVQMPYTLVNGRVELAIQPLNLIDKAAEHRLTMNNASGAARQYQIWVIT